MSPRRLGIGYLLAAASVGLALGLRLMLDPALGPSFPFATLFLAVMASAAYGGLGPGLAATFLGAGAAVLYLLPPAAGFSVEGLENQAGLALYLVVSLGITVFGAALRRARDEAFVLAEGASRDGEQLRITLASIGDGVIVTDAQGRVVSMNPVAEGLTGWKSAEAALKPLEAVFRIVNEETRQKVENPVARVLREGKSSALANHTVLVARDGRDRSIDDSAAPIRDGEKGIVGVVLVFREIAERRRGEAAQRLLASIVENSQDAIYGKALDGTITSWNAGAERLFGYKAEEVLGKPSNILTPADRLGEQSAIFMGRADNEPVETVRRRKDDRVIHVSMSISPVRNAAGVVTGSSTIARDITLQKRAEAELHRAEERLREADRRKDEFLAILAHELRNPLAPLRNALLILKRAETSSAMAVEARDMAERQVHHLARLVDDLLDVSRITHGRIELQTERIELSSTVARAVETALPAVEAQGHELTVSLPEEPVWLDADVVRLAQIFANLLNNAAQYTKPGGKIALDAARSGDEVEIRISDTGLGITPEALPRIFDLFTQASPPQSRPPSSLGIGLRLVKGLVEMHGGRVEALSPGLGQGSVFVVRLPVASAPDSRAASIASAPPAASPPRRILVVDDNVDAAASLAVLLRLDGHDTRVAYSGAEALEAIEAEAPDVVLLDIGMPGMDGYEVARLVRQQPKLAALRLVALTGWGQEHDRKRAREAGFDHHLTKPVEPSALQAVIAGDASS